jgi:hypothetical protein
MEFATQTTKEGDFQDRKPVNHWWIGSATPKLCARGGLDMPVPVKASISAVEGTGSGWLGRAHAMP